MGTRITKTMRRRKYLSDFPSLMITRSRKSWDLAWEDVVLCCTPLNVLHYSSMYFTVMHCTAVQCTVSYCNILWSMYCTVGWNKFTLMPIFRFIKKNNKNSNKYFI